MVVLVLVLVLVLFLLYIQHLFSEFEVKINDMT